MRSVILASGLLLAMSGTVAAGQIYKWVDAQGVTHFGAQPPSGQSAEAISTATPQPKPAAAPATSETDNVPEQEEIDRKVRQQVAEEEAKRREYCTSLRTHLAQLQNNPRIRLEEAGEIRRLNEEERQARIEEARHKLQENCD